MLFSDLGRASENLKPGQFNKEDQRPGTVPRVKKYDFGGESGMFDLGSRNMILGVSQACLYLGSRSTILEVSQACLT